MAPIVMAEQSEDKGAPPAWGKIASKSP